MIKENKVNRFTSNENALNQAKEAEPKPVTKYTSSLTDEDISRIANDDIALENIVNQIRETPEKASNPDYKKIFEKVTDNNAAEFSRLKEEVDKEKKRIYEKVKNEKPFSADISNKNSLKRNYVEVFGRKKDFISFEDYMTLLEMKRVIEIDEQKELAELEEV